MEKGMLYFIAVCVLVMVLLMGGAFAYSRAECNAKTAQLGMPSQWGLMSGCLVQVETGQWIPLDNYYWKDE